MQLQHLPTAKSLLEFHDCAMCVNIASSNDLFLCSTSGMFKRKGYQQRKTLLSYRGIDLENRKSQPVYRIALISLFGVRDWKIVQWKRPNNGLIEGAL